MTTSAGEIRRSFAASTFGPGAVVDLRGEGAPLSVVMGGLEEWENNGGTPAQLRHQAVFEPRLQKKLGVKRFLLPPAFDEAVGARLGAVRFPSWLQCPQCHEMKQAGSWNRLLGKAGRFCQPCTAKNPGQRKAWAIPVRFVTACESGHLDEFPWHWWVQHKADCAKQGVLKLVSCASGLAGLVLSCIACKAERSMDGIFTQDGLKGVLCKGRRPWLPAADVACSKALHTMQRGASNLYFPITESALTIPPFSERLADLYGEFWEAIQNCEPGRRLDFIRDLWPTLPRGPYTPEQVAHYAQVFQEKLGGADDQNDLRRDEYEVLAASEKYERPGEEFLLRPGTPTAVLADMVSRISRVDRLREVRAIRAFTRLAPPSGDFKIDSIQAAALSVQTKDWLPAIEVRGEGLFISLNQTRLNSWEAIAEVRERAAMLDKQHILDFEARHGAEALATRSPVTPRFVLVHSLAHALIRHLALDCGYSSASLRERTYASQNGAGMAGVLIYTATTDADGTLGGLVRQGRPQRFEEVLTGAIQELRWCSSDPLCIEGMAALSDGMNGAACHGCLLAAETSCEHFNRFLDRALLVGSPSNADVGFFSPLLD